MNALHGAIEESSVRLTCACIIALLILTVLGGLMVDGVGCELTYVGPQEEEEDDDDNDEEEDNDNGGNNNDDDVDVIEQDFIGSADAPTQQL